MKEIAIHDYDFFNSWFLCGSGCCGYPPRTPKYVATPLFFAAIFLVLDVCEKQHLRDNLSYWNKLFFICDASPRDVTDRGFVLSSLGLLGTYGYIIESETWT